MAPVVWFLVEHADGNVSIEYKVWDGWTKERILVWLLSTSTLYPPVLSYDDNDRLNFAVLRVDEDESYTIPF